MQQIRRTKTPSPRSTNTSSRQHSGSNPRWANPGQKYITEHVCMNTFSSGCLEWIQAVRCAHMHPGMWRSNYYTCIRMYFFPGNGGYVKYFCEVRNAERGMTVLVRISYKTQKHDVACSNSRTRSDTLASLVFGLCRRQMYSWILTRVSSRYFSSSKVQIYTGAKCAVLVQNYEHWRKRRCRWLFTSKFILNTWNNSALLRAKKQQSNFSANFTGW